MLRNFLHAQYQSCNIPVSGVVVSIQEDQIMIGVLGSDKVSDKGMEP